MGARADACVRKTARWELWTLSVRGAAVLFQTLSLVYRQPSRMARSGCVTYECVVSCGDLRCPPTCYAQSTDGDKPYSDLEVVKALRVMYRVRQGTAA